MAGSSDSARLEVRVLLCPNCGAPIKAPAGGGEVPCEHCQSPLIVTPRPKDPISEVSEAERQAMLKGQRASGGRRRMPPVPLHMQAAFMEARKPEKRQAALQKVREAFAGMRGVVMGSPSEDQVFALFQAANGLAEVERRYGEFDRGRATLESTLDLLPNRDLRDRVRLAIARNELAAGDDASAQSWVAEVDPRPLSLEIDTELRLTRALIALRAGQHGEALDLVGQHDAVVYFAIGSQPAQSVLALVQAHALTGLGREPEALAALKNSVSLHVRPQLFLEMAVLYPGPADALVPKVAGKAGRGFRIAMWIVLIAIAAGIAAAVILGLTA